MSDFPPRALLVVARSAPRSNCITLLGIFETEDSSEIEMILFLPDLRPKSVLVQNPLSILWVLFPISDLTVLYPLETKQLYHILLQLSPLRHMMSLCLAKHWEMFHFSIVSRSKTKQKVFKTLLEIPLACLIYFSCSICKFSYFICNLRSIIYLISRLW